jgi:hypothetical protein
MRENETVVSDIAILCLLLHKKYRFVVSFECSEVKFANMCEFWCE